MGRKPSPKTSHGYGSFIVSLLYRSIELMSTGGGVSQHAATLDKTLGSIFKIPEIRGLAASVLERMCATSEAEWRRGVRRFLNDCLPLLSRAFKEAGMRD